jgi:hypothetical protein
MTVRVLACCLGLLLACDGGGDASGGAVADAGGGVDTGASDSGGTTDGAGPADGTGRDSGSLLDGGEDAAAPWDAGGDAGVADGAAVDAGADATAGDATGDAGGPCLPEGTPTNVGAATPCCAGLEALPTAMTLPDGTCLPARCLDCLICVKGCGDGQCTTGEDSCSCPADCEFDPSSGPGGPCETHEDCVAPGGCLPEASGYPTGGYCTGGVCDPSSEPTTCPGGTACVATIFASAYLCMPTCSADGQCGDARTCEAFPEQAPTNGEYLCWESALGKPNATGGLGLGDPCVLDSDCLSNLCLVHPTSAAKVCSAYCNDDKACKASQTCEPMGGCGFPGCGACFTP